MVLVVLAMPKLGCLNSGDYRFDVQDENLGEVSTNERFVRRLEVKSSAVPECTAGSEALLTHPERRKSCRNRNEFR
jgi:hypothetical protein